MAIFKNGMKANKTAKQVYSKIKPLLCYLTPLLELYSFHFSCVGMIIINAYGLISSTQHIHNMAPPFGILQIFSSLHFTPQVHRR